MTEEMQELGRRAVACKGWRWMLGMSATGQGYLDTLRVIDVDHGDPCLPDCWEYRGYLRGRENGDDWPTGEVVPNLTDPATLGCLLALVREAHHDWGICPRCTSDLGPANGWYCWPSRSRFTFEAAALVAALEAAP
jgi:hypothetical protein